MATDTTNIETIQAQLYRDVLRQQRCGALRRLLDDFALQGPDTPTDYRGLLTRVLTLVSEELAGLDAEAAPQAEATATQGEDARQTEGDGLPEDVEEGTK